MGKRMERQHLSFFPATVSVLFHWVPKDSLRLRLKLRLRFQEVQGNPGTFLTLKMMYNIFMLIHIHIINRNPSYR